MHFRKRWWFLLFATIIIFSFATFHLKLFDHFEIIATNNIEDHLVKHDYISGENPVIPSCSINVSIGIMDYRGDFLSVQPNFLLDYRTVSLPNGGFWRPFGCAPNYHVAVVIPFRDNHGDRKDHLATLLPALHAALQRIKARYTIFVVQQTLKKPFNRGKLFNVAFAEILKTDNFPCFIFHDVDLVPLNPNNIYACTKQPRHMANGVSKSKFSVPYEKYFGGITAILSEQYRLVDGFSNNFYGWGGEDDDFYIRVARSGFKPCRFEWKIASYISLYHNPSQEFHHGQKLFGAPFGTDGLSTLKYELTERKFLMGYTLLTVNI